MVLKRPSDTRIRTTYQWRIFIPIVTVIWLILAVVGWWMYTTEHRLREEGLRSQVSFINSRIVATYENDQNADNFYKFISKYYVDNPLFDEIRVSVYHDGNLVHHIGKEIKPTDTKNYQDGSVVITSKAKDAERRERNMFYDKTKSGDQRLIVYTILPFDPDVVAATRTSVTLYFVLVGVGLVATLMIYVMTRRLGRNIRSLRDFALRAGNDPNFVPSMDFAHDELGDISRQIVRFYHDRNKSMIKLKREHNVALHALEDKARMKRDLTNNINHELKTPIAVIKGYLDTIREHPDMDADSRNHFLSKVSDHVDRLTQLLNDLSSITRLEYGSQMINTETVDFHEVVFHAANDFETSGVLQGMEFNYDVPTYCRVVGNVNLLQGVINNLAKNAVAYSKGTECDLILTDKDDEFFYFSFYDNGVGVKETSIPHLFERFFREDTGRSRKKGGTGLGLAIVQNSIEALGGTIAASNRPGGGLLFRFSLRRADAPVAEGE